MRIIHSFALLALLAVPTAAMATTIDISTGQGALGSNDAHYIVTTPSATTGAAYIIPPNPGWTVQPAYDPTPGAANWIGPTADSGTVSVAGGSYLYTIKFYVTDPSIASITGGFASDNAASVLLNGNATGFFNLYGPPYSFSSLTPFTLSSGFVVGANTLTFHLANGNGGSDTAGPSGLIASTMGSGISLTPEPSSMLLLGTGLLSVAGVARRKFLRA